MLSVSESAKILGVSTARVRQLIASGAIEATKVGGSWSMPEAAVYDRLSKRPPSGRPAVGNKPKPLDSSEDERSNQAMHDLYLQCKKAFSFSPSFELIKSAKTQEEANFYMAVGDFFLREKQRELVKQGVF